jgi:hypothetical protein
MLEAVSKLGRLLHWLKVKNPKAPAVRREVEGWT